MQPKIATGFDRLAIDLGEHIRFYKPGGWAKPIHDVAHPPLFSADEARTFIEAHRENQLKNRLEKLGQSNDFPFNQVEPWYVKEAIEDFFSKELYSPYESEL